MNGWRFFNVMERITNSSERIIAAANATKLYV